MKTYQLQYTMNLHVDSEINHHYFSFRCLPKADPRQTIRQVKVLLDVDYYSYSTDCFGNHFVYGYQEAPAQDLNFFMEACVAVDSMQFDWDNRLHSVYCLPTAKTCAAGALAEFAADCERACESLPNAYEKAVYVMKAVHQAMTYEKGRTVITTTAADAFAQKCGVCQDYAQIMLAVLRYMHIPARYVAGVMAGEPLSHAWVDVLSSSCWRGLDPTNNRLVDDDYISLSCGRDYKDCLVNKGIFYSPEPVTQKQDITVSMTECMTR